MKMNGRLHASAALPRKKSLRYPLEQQLGLRAGLDAVEERKIPCSAENQAQIPW
jgi:hypothetical protein